MKKAIHVFLAAILLGGTFMVGSWYGHQDLVKSRGPGVDGQSFSNQPEDQTNDPGSLPPGAVKITPEKQQMIGVRVGTATMAAENHAVRALGRVAADENRTYRITASTEGWVWDVHASTTGSLVKKDQLMATVYNYQFLTRQQQYLYALEFEERKQSRPQGASPQTPGGQTSGGQQPGGQQTGALQQTLPSATFSTVSVTPGGETNPAGRAVYSIRDQVQVAKLELYALGVGDHQIQEITRTKKLAADIEIRSPVDGIVLSRNISPQQRFDRGIELFRVADLGRVWILADVYSGEAKYIKPGIKARVSLPGQEKVFKASVTEVPPPFDTATRTLKVRLETDNPGIILRPDMFVDVEFLLTLPPAVTLPVDAVLDSGLKKTVFVDRGNGFFEPRGVETGWRFGGRVEVVKGLAPGERVVVSGNFLIDSESKLEMASSGMPGGPTKDPVCGVEVSPKKAEKGGRMASYRGQAYYFDSDECRENFSRNPERYVAKPAREESLVPPSPVPKATGNKAGPDHQHH